MTEYVDFALSDLVNFKTQYYQRTMIYNEIGVTYLYLGELFILFGVIIGETLKNQVELTLKYLIFKKSQKIHLFIYNKCVCISICIIVLVTFSPAI